MAIDRETQVMMDAYTAGIRAPRELANYMAQVTHESNGLSRLEESFRYTRNISQIPTRAAWREGTTVLDDARKEALRGQPEKLAELMHGGRNGNDQPGDGWNYRGRGYLPLAGKDNYRAAGEALGIDLVGKPDLAAEPGTASKVAAWCWSNRVPHEAREDVRAATRAINGKLHGVEDRERRFADWERRLTPAVMERLESGLVGQPLENRGAHAAGVDAPAKTPAAAHSPTPNDYQVLLDQARKGVHALDAHHGRASDQLSDNLSGSLAVAARRDGLGSIDHVVLSDDASQVYAVQGELNSPHKRMSGIATAQAINTPLEQSLATLKQMPDPTQATSQEQQQQQQQRSAPSGPGH